MLKGEREVKKEAVGEDQLLKHFIKENEINAEMDKLRVHTVVTSGVKNLSS